MMVCRLGKIFVGSHLEHHCGIIESTKLIKTVLNDPL